uniref:EamA family transporter n=1 Tax=Agathobacter sp. TaxID=2021311 RepID=UPI004055C231
MWILYAAASAVFAGITSILAKIGMQNTDSNLGTALRTGVVLVFSWIMVAVTGALPGIYTLTGTNYLFLVLSGLATGASWICYFRALQLGNVNKVTPIDKSSTILTMILAFVILGEPISGFMLLGMVLMGAGTLLMIQKKEGEAEVKDQRWLIYALLSAVFAALTSILGKMGVQGINSNLGTAIRTIVVLIMAWAIVFAQGKQKQIPSIDKRSWIFLVLSGISTGASWLFYYRALQDGVASIVVPIDKLSIVVTIVFARVFLKEKLSKKALIGLLGIVAGTFVLLL